MLGGESSMEKNKVWKEEKSFGVRWELLFYIGIKEKFIYNFYWGRVLKGDRKLCGWLEGK